MVYWQKIWENFILQTTALFYAKFLSNKIRDICFCNR